MDDYFDSVIIEKKAEKIVGHVIYIHKQGGFNIRSWMSNSRHLLTSIAAELRANTNLDTSHKILDLYWVPDEDLIEFSSNHFLIGSSSASKTSSNFDNDKIDTSTSKIS